MNSPIKYSFELLNKFCLEKGVNLINDYSNEKLFGSTKIIFNCTNCNKINTKCFTYLIKRNTLCKSCVTILSLPKQKETMLKKYGVEHSSQSLEIKNKIKQKFIEKYGVDNPAKLQTTKDKQKKTNLQKYGVEYIINNKVSKQKMIETNIEKYGFGCCLQNKIVKEKVIKTNLQKFGCENVGQNHQIQEKMKNTMFKKYGVSYPLQNKEIMNNLEKTCLKKYGFKNCLLNNEIKIKVKDTMKNKYGVEYALQNDEIKNKIKETCLKKYGFENPMQNKEIAQKSSQNCYKPKLFIFPSGNEIKCQGYEPFALEELIKNKEENDIITGCKNVPMIWYNDETGKKHRHYVDIYIPSQNKCIEIKSTWTIKKKKSYIFEKQIAGKELGYNYEIWVYDSKGNKIETFI